MALRLRLRGPSGGATINLPAGATVAALETLARDTLELGAGAALEFLVGHPPKPVSVSPDGTPQLSSGDTLVVRLGAAAADDGKRQRTEPEAAAPQPAPQPAATGGAPMAVEDDEEAMLAQAIALSQGGSVPAQPAAPPPAAVGEQLVRRVVPADNSCLFVCVAHALEGGDRSRAGALRETVAAAVLADQERFSEAVLGRPPHEYAQWIRNKEHWGGGIELAILAEHYQTELAAFDCQSLRVDCFGQGCGYGQRVLLIYDGIHYDLLVRTPFADAPADFDVCVFEAADEAAMAEGRALARRAQQAGKYTDTASFTIRCLVCQRGLTGEKEAVEHAKATGHTNFSEFK
jgi:ubiquitin thioesterase OTU1